MTIRTFDERLRKAYSRISVVNKKMIDNFNDLVLTCSSLGLDDSGLWIEHLHPIEKKHRYFERVKNLEKKLSMANCH